jgi:ectoine hydroxylase-related dioxygenase (phytanoyl-CoA dioxygenase family)
VDGEQVCSVWLPLVPVPRSVSPEFVAGSHRWGKTFAPRKFVDHRPYEGSLSAFETVPDIDARRTEYEILAWDLEPGDAIVFHMKTLHGAPGTAEHRFRRRAFSTRWLGDDAVFATRPFPTSPPFPGLGLKPGEPMEHELFPVVYRALQGDSLYRAEAVGHSTDEFARRTSSPPTRSSACAAISSNTAAGM